MINLLPSQYKKEIEMEETFRLLAILGVSFFVFFLSLVLMLFSLRIYFASQIETQEILIESFKEKSGLQGKISDEVKRLNGILASVDQFYQNQVLPSEILARISSHMPEDMYLTAFSLAPPAPPKKKGDRVDYKAALALRGYAKDRDSLVKFKEGLEQDPLFQGVQFPLSNFTNPNNFSANLQWSP